MAAAGAAVRFQRMTSATPLSAIDGSQSPPAWRKVLADAGGALLGAILLIAAYAKAIDPAAFAEQIEAEGLALVLPATTWAIVGVAVEVGLGLALLLGLRSRAVLVAASLLVLLFVLLTGRTYWQALHGVTPAAANCGCFGNLVDRSPGEAFWQDLVLLVPSLLLAWTARPDRRRGVGWRAGLATAAAAGAAAFAWAAPGLPLDDRATRLAPGVRIEELCAGRDSERICLAHLAPELARGQRWVVMADPADAAFDPLVQALNAYALSGAQPPVALLADLKPEERLALFWRFAPAFDLHEVPNALLRPLYRTLPRSFLLDGGRVVRTAPGIARELGALPGEPTTPTRERP